MLKGDVNCTKDQYRCAEVKSHIKVDCLRFLFIIVVNFVVNSMRAALPVGCFACKTKLNHRMMNCQHLYEIQITT